MHWYLDVLRRYAVFSGRARRKEYWMFVLINILVLILFQVTIAVIAPNPSAGEFRLPIALSLIAYCLFIFLPSMAVAVRRLHDTNHGGYWIFISLIPLVGGIALFVLHVLDGTSGDNRFGPDPKGRQVPVVV
jgi:uncharacterized membrane protein YhaH (DUF805 family)